MARIASIYRAVIRTYTDTGQVVAYVDWTDTKGKAGTTSGDPANGYMVALLARAEREGLTVERESW